VEILGYRIDCYVSRTFILDVLAVNQNTESVHITTWMNHAMFLSTSVSRIYTAHLSWLSMVVLVAASMPRFLAVLSNMEHTVGLWQSSSLCEAPSTCVSAGPSSLVGRQSCSAANDACNIHTQPARFCLLHVFDCTLYQTLISPPLHNINNVMCCDSSHFFFTLFCNLYDTISNAKV